MTIATESLETATMAAVPITNRPTTHEQAGMSSSLPTPPFHKTNPQFCHSPLPDSTITVTTTYTRRDPVDRRFQTTNDAVVTLEDLDDFVLHSTNLLPSSVHSDENDTPLGMNDFTLFNYDYEPIHTTHLFPPL